MSKFGFEKVLLKIEQVKRELPRIWANDAQNYFLASFRKQSWNNVPWEEVQRRIAGTPAYKYPSSKGLSRRTKPINIMTGRLRRAVASTARNASVRSTKTNFVVVMKLNNSMVPYGKYINEGTDKMVARPFMKDSPELRRILRRRLDSYMSRIWGS